MILCKEIEKTFPILEKAFTQKELLDFKNIQIGDLCMYHFGFGTWIRNNLLYPDKSILHHLFLEYGICHEDDMSFLIIQQFHQYLLNKI